MTLEEYKNKRETLLQAMQTMIDQGDMQDLEAKKQEIEDLDAAFEQAKNAQADLNALKGAAPVPEPLQQNAVLKATGAEKLDAASPEYRNAFFKHLLGRDEEMTRLENAAFTQTTENTPAPLPTTMLNKIWDLVSGQHVIMGDIKLYRTGTVLEVVKHTAIAQGKAKKVNEAQANEDEQNTFVKVTLAGHDFSKHIDISYAAAKMSVNALERYLTDEIAAGLGEAMADDVVAAIQNGINAANKVNTAENEAVSYGELAKLFGKLKRVNNMVLYATRATIYNYLVSMVDTTGRPIFQPNAQAGAQGVLLGAVIKVEDSIGDNVILVGDPKKVTYNMVQDIMLETDKDIKKHVHTYSGYARGQGALIDDLAFAQLTITPAAGK